MEIEPAERQEKIPTESQKEKEREREIARGIKAYCCLEGNYCRGRGHEGKKGDMSEEMAANRRKSCNNSPETRERRVGEGIFRTALMRKVKDERCNKR